MNETKATLYERNTVTLTLEEFLAYRDGNNKLHEFIEHLESCREADGRLCSWKVVDMVEVELGVPEKVESDG